MMKSLKQAIHFWQLALPEPREIYLAGKS